MRTRHVSVLFFLVFAGCTLRGSTERLLVEDRQITDLTTHSQNQDTAFGLIKQWAMRNYNFPQEVIALADPEAGLLVFKEFGVIKRGDGEQIAIGYTLTMQVVDRQVRFIYTIGDPNVPDITTTDDGRQMEEYFEYLKIRILKAIEEDELLQPE
jgi:hypothetical protein